MEEILYFGGKIRKIALLFPKISQTELFPPPIGVNEIMVFVFLLLNNW